MTSRNRISALVFLPVTILATAAALRGTLLFEEVRITPRMYPRVPPPDGPDLTEREKEYLDWLDSYVSWLVRVARSHQRCYTALMCASGFSSLAVSFVLVVRAPIWAPALLTFLAGAGQLLLANMRNQKLSLTIHEQSVRLQRLRRDFAFAEPARDDRAARKRFTEFREAVERIKEDYGTRAFGIRGQEPIQPPLPTATG
ncbi:hypothetical protein NX801_14275 [Streptomyces sp. LP05-1]|uniref:SMODS and SLOG-associating 2TM effector domain-containing protein n=1 Tax=Streptomyces pyxinae TaxID=2970734 RepID=A0ABT2CHB9_9ACTN|nr:hypothetical protein [Streptomyces sp. LP05-1]MCS0636806.1 hypothetical protein [Streptomyces sp. LP05-1]